MADTEPKIQNRPYSLQAVECMLRAALGQARDVLAQAGDDDALAVGARRVVEDLDALLARLAAQRSRMKAGRGR